MNTPLEADGARISRRKLHHLDVCADPALPIEDPRGAGFDKLHLIHECLPETDADAVDTRCEFLGYSCRLPLLVSCMTGGTGDGSPCNVHLARLAQKSGLPLGLGSMRILFHDQSLLPDFAMRRYAPDVPLLANIGAAQLASLTPGQLIEMTRRLEADALVVHLNPGQEIVQPDGDRDFRGVFDAIRRLCEQESLPIIVKETGYGIRPRRVRELLAAGVAWVDLAGAGGTDWLQVESCTRQGEQPSQSDQAGLARDCLSWGLQTALILAALAAAEDEDFPGWLASRRAWPVIASGGVKSGLDIARAIALGAGLTGMALPFVRAHASGGEAALERLVASIDESLRGIMFLCGARNLDGLRRVGLLAESEFMTAVSQLAALDRV